MASRGVKKGTHPGNSTILFHFSLGDVSRTNTIDFVVLPPLPIPSCPLGKTELQVPNSAELGGVRVCHGAGAVRSRGTEGCRETEPSWAQAELSGEELSWAEFCWPQASPVVWKAGDTMWIIPSCLYWLRLWDGKHQPGTASITLSFSWWAMWNWTEVWTPFVCKTHCLLYVFVTNITAVTVDFSFRCCLFSVGCYLHP